LRQADDDVDAAVAEVLGMGVALRSVADHGHGLALERRRIDVPVVVHARGHFFIASSMDPAPRDITTAPVRTRSLIPNVPTSPTNVSTSASVPLTSTITDSGPRSTIRPRASSTTLTTSARFASVGRIFTRAGSCS